MNKEVFKIQQLSKLMREEFQEVLEYANDLLLELEDKTDKVSQLRLNYLLKLLLVDRPYLNESGRIKKLIPIIYKKKIDMIKEATTKKEMENILGLPKIRYDGEKIVPENEKYHIIEEELIMWSITSLKAPLSPVGIDRYMECFKKVFPESYKTVVGHLDAIVEDKRFCLTCGKYEDLIRNIRLNEEIVGTTVSKIALKKRLHYLKEGEKILVCDECLEEICL